MPQCRMVARMRYVDVDVGDGAAGAVAAQVNDAHAAHLGARTDPTFHFLRAEGIGSAGERPYGDGSATTGTAPSAHEPIGSGDAVAVRSVLLGRAVIFDSRHR